MREVSYRLPQIKTEHIKRFWKQHGFRPLGAGRQERFSEEKGVPPKNSIRSQMNRLQE